MTAAILAESKNAAIMFIYKALTHNHATVANMQVRFSKPSLSATQPPLRTYHKPFTIIRIDLQARQTQAFQHNVELYFASVISPPQLKYDLFFQGCGERRPPSEFRQIEEQRLA